MANPAERTDAGETTLWVIQPDGSEEVRLGAGDFPVWSPDGSTLAFQTKDGVFAVKPGNWLPFPVTLPDTARVIDWVVF
jgi:Tol biopolymer transport system component